MTEDRIKGILKATEKMLRTPDVVVSQHTSVRNVTEPGDSVLRYKRGEGRRLVIEVPCKPGEYYHLEGC